MQIDTLSFQQATPLGGLAVVQRSNGGFVLMMVVVGTVARHCLFVRSFAGEKNRRQTNGGSKQIYELSTTRDPKVPIVDSDYHHTHCCFWVCTTVLIDFEIHLSPVSH